MTPQQEFSGLQIYRDLRGEIAVRVFERGMITQLEPTDEDRAMEPGFYDEKMNRIADPTTDEGKIDAVLAKLETKT